MNALKLKITKPYSHFSKAAEVKGRYSPEEKSKLVQTSKDFESILTTMMIRSMTKTTDGLFGKDNYGGDVLDVLFETEIANHITNSQGLGVADKIYKNLTGESLPLTKVISRERPLSVIATNNNEVKSISKNKTVPSNGALNRIKQYNNLIEDAANKYKIDKKLIQSVILTESAGKANAMSNAKAKGLMQLIDSTATDMGVTDPWNPKQNINGGAKYLSKLLKQFNGDTDLALAAYNAGPGNVKKYKGIPPFKETQNYIKRVNNYLNILE